MNVNRRECLKYIGLLGAAATGLSGCKLSDLFSPLPTTVKGHLLRFIQETGAPATITEQHAKKGPCSFLEAIIPKRDASRDYPVFSFTLPHSDPDQLSLLYLTLPQKNILNHHKDNILEIRPDNFAMIAIDQKTGKWERLDPDNTNEALKRKPDRVSYNYLFGLIVNSETATDGKTRFQAQDVLNQLYGDGASTQIIRGISILGLPGILITPQVDLGRLENYGFQSGSSWEIKNGAVQREIVPSCQDSTR